MTRTLGVAFVVSCALLAIVGRAAGQAAPATPPPGLQQPPANPEEGAPPGAPSPTPATEPTPAPSSDSWGTLIDRGQRVSGEESLASLEAEAREEEERDRELASARHGLRIGFGGVVAYVGASGAGAALAGSAAVVYGFGLLALQLDVDLGIVAREERYYEDSGSYDLGRSEATLAPLIAVRLGPRVYLGTLPVYIGLSGVLMVLPTIDYDSIFAAGAALSGGYLLGARSSWEVGLRAEGGLFLGNYGVVVEGAIFVKYWL